MSKKIELSKSTFKISLNTIDIEENNILAFENSLENYLKEKKHVVALNSATSAIHLALILSGVTNGDEVLCQSFTFVASVNPILYQNATPIFIDSEKDTWNMCPMYLEKAILDRIAKGKKPKAIVLVHLYGMPSKMDEILKIAKKYNILLIEDAAEALGAEYKGQKCGTFGDYGVFSFNNNKIITTFGGGALVCKSKNDKKKAVFLSEQARDIAPHYQHSTIGYNYRISNILAAIGYRQMQFLEENLIIRKTINKNYKLLLKKIKGISFLERPNKSFTSNNWLTCIIIDERITGFSKEKLRILLKENNIESRSIWKPMHLQPVFQNFPFYGNTICKELFERGLCLPSGSSITKEDLKTITLTIKKLL